MTNMGKRDLIGSPRHRLNSPFIIKTPGAQLADELRRRIALGELGEFFPGVKLIMSEYRVTRAVVEAATEELVKSKDIVRGGAREASKILARPREKAERKSLILQGDTYEHWTGPKVLINELKTALNAEVSTLGLGINAPVDAIVRRVEEAGFDRVLVTNHRSEVTDALIKAKKIAVSLGGVGVPALGSLVGTSGEMLTRNAMRRAFEAGHRRVCHPVWSRSAVVASRIRRQVAEEYARAGLPHSIEFDVPHIQNYDPPALHAYMLAIIRHTPPSAIIVGGLRQWIATMSVLASAGLRVPNDISVICEEECDELSAATPSVAHFSYPVARMAAVILESFAKAEAGLPPAFVTIDTVWVPGGSLARFEK